MRTNKLGKTVLSLTLLLIIGLIATFMLSATVFGSEHFKLLSTASTDSITEAHGLDSLSKDCKDCWVTGKENGEVASMILLQQYTYDLSSRPALQNTALFSLTACWSGKADTCEDNAEFDPSAPGSGIIQVLQGDEWVDLGEPIHLGHIMDAQSSHLQTHTRVLEDLSSYGDEVTLRVITTGKLFGRHYEVFMHTDAATLA